MPRRSAPTIGRGDRLSGHPRAPGAGQAPLRAGGLGARPGPQLGPGPLCRPLPLGRPGRPRRPHRRPRQPAGGALLAVHTLAVKYTSQVYLEALPHLASTVAVLAFTRSRAGRDRWFWLSAVALGVTAASKFTYLPVAVSWSPTWPWRPRARWRDLLLYGLVALAVFLAAQPHLWRDPLPGCWTRCFSRPLLARRPRARGGLSLVPAPLLDHPLAPFDLASRRLYLACSFWWCGPPSGRSTV
jgi:hypothetical protein